MSEKAAVLIGILLFSKDLLNMWQLGRCTVQCRCIPYNIQRTSHRICPLPCAPVEQSFHSSGQQPPLGDATVAAGPGESHPFDPLDQSRQWKLCPIPG